MSNSALLPGAKALAACVEVGLGLTAEAPWEPPQGSVPSRSIYVAEVQPQPQTEDREESRGFLLCGPRFQRLACSKASFLTLLSGWPSQGAGGGAVRLGPQQTRGMLSEPAVRDTHVTRACHPRSEGPGWPSRFAQPAAWDTQVAGQELGSSPAVFSTICEGQPSYCDLGGRLKGPW